MSAQASFPRFWKKDPLSPSSADRHTQPSCRGFPEVAVYPSEGSHVVPNERNPGDAPAPKRFLLFADSQTAVWLQEDIKGKDMELFFQIEMPGQGKHYGFRVGSFPAWTSGQTYTEACFHDHMSPSFHVWEGTAGLPEGSTSGKVSLGLECTLATLPVASTSKPTGTAEAPVLLKHCNTASVRI